VNDEMKWYYKKCYLFYFITLLLYIYIYLLFLLSQII